MIADSPTDPRPPNSNVHLPHTQCDSSLAAMLNVWVDLLRGENRVCSPSGASRVH